MGWWSEINEEGTDTETHRTVNSTYPSWVDLITPSCVSPVPLLRKQGVADILIYKGYITVGMAAICAGGHDSKMHVKGNRGNVGM